MDFVSSTKWLTTCESNQSNSSISNDYYPTLPEFLFLFVMFITWKKYMNLLFNGISILCILTHQYGDNILLPVTTQNQKHQIFFIIFFFLGGGSCSFNCYSNPEFNFPYLASTRTTDLFKPDILTHRQY